MSIPSLEALRADFEEAGQGHVFRHWAELEPSQQRTLERQLRAVDLALVARHGALLQSSDAAAASNLAPPDFFPLNRSAEQEAQARQAAALGANLLAAGKIGFVLVAGGQGSRLGFDGPKGAFEIGPVTNKSLFAWHAARIQAASYRYGFDPLWFVMTSEANDDETRAFFEAQDYFGLSKQNLFFFTQDMLPALDANGRILLASKHELFLAPDGHGGTLAALSASGALEVMAEEGIEQLSYFQVDSPLTRPADPLFIGLHAEAGAQMSSKVVPKRDAHEKVGVLGLVDGKLGCIEYSDLTDDLRHARNEATGELLFNAGNIAAHMIRRDFIESLASGGALDLPWHIARKSIPSIDAAGAPTQVDGVKFETFVFDALARTRSSVVLEVERAQEFSPVKNAEGSDSPETARADLTRIGAELMAGHPDWNAADFTAIEIDPRVAETPEEFRTTAAHGRKVNGGIVFEPDQEGPVAG
ncbi:putative uridylyltransferase [Planctomycetes bacterium Poly30]|uniref:Putative uridylyltransferase n=1 Tax=Saltatorellus ferox TaxID=2528018 RepID=A0A518ETC4_9BACT|nr:putative uridylyltransferase [Planctomycetes bacterium Poly30]